MDSGQRTILLVEDNPMDVDLTRRAFARRRIANPLQVARDGEEALALIPEWESGVALPIVILLDVKLPKIPGLEVLKVLKSHPVLRAIPVVMLTTSQDDADVHAAYGLGVNSYILKPVDFDKFAHVVEQIDLYWSVINHSPR